jgi:hypothetical protein
MDAVTIATAMLNAQMSLTQGQLGATMLKQQHEATQQVVSLITQSVQSAPAPQGTGSIVNEVA